MFIDKKSGRDERRELRVLFGMASDKTVLAGVSQHWDGKGLSTPWANRVASLCVEYYKQYEKAPGTTLIGLCRSWLEEHDPDIELLQGIERFAGEFSDHQERNGKPTNPQHELDVVIRHLNRVRLRRLADGIQAELDRGKQDRAEELVIKHAKLDAAGTGGVDLFNDLEALKATYAKENREPLIVYPGGLGELIGPRLRKDCFIGFMGAEKTGKSFWLLDIAWRAICSRRRVLYVQAGDLSDSQINDRFIIRARRRPSFSNNHDGKWPCTVQYPRSIELPPQPRKDTPFVPAPVVHEEKKFDQPLDREEGWAERVVQEVRKETKSEESYFHLVCKPTKTISVLGIESCLQSLEIQGWKPDVVVVDYADILAPADRKMDKLEQIKDTWEGLRKISQEWRCLLVTATQVNAESYRKRTLDRSNFSGNHLKYAEVSAMFAINTSGEEMAVGVSRLNCVAAREGFYNVRRQAHVAGCLALSKIAVCSVIEPLSWYSKGD